MSFTLGELAVRFGCSLKGDPDARVSHVATLEAAGPDAVTFLANPKYRRHLSKTRAGAVIVEPRLAEACPGAALVIANPYATYARIAALLHPVPAMASGVHASAVVDPFGADRSDRCRWTQSRGRGRCSDRAWRRDRTGVHCHAGRPDRDRYATRRQCHALPPRHARRALSAASRSGYRGRWFRPRAGSWRVDQSAAGRRRADR